MSINTMYPERCKTPEEVTQALFRGAPVLIEAPLNYNFNNLKNQGITSRSTGFCAYSIVDCKNVWLYLDSGFNAVNIAGDSDVSVYIYGNCHTRLTVSSSKYVKVALFSSSMTDIIHSGLGSFELDLVENSHANVLLMGAGSSQINLSGNSHLSGRIVQGNLHLYQDQFSCAEINDESRGSFVTAENTANSNLTINMDLGSAKVTLKNSARLFAEGPVMVESTSSLCRAQLGGPLPKFAGQGQVIRNNLISLEDWVKYYEVKEEGEYLILYKALGEGFYSKWNFTYLPGTVVEAPDWDPEIECGGGLHFSPTPRMARAFNLEAKKFVACKVKASEVLFLPNGNFPEKVKAPKVYEIYEVDINGVKVGL